MKTRNTAGLLYLVFILLQVGHDMDVLAHPGRIDDNSGHTNLVTGVYHCHRADCIPPESENDKPTKGPARYGTQTSDHMMAMRKIYGETFYCGCPFNEDKTIDFTSCRYAPVDKYLNRLKIEQEHVVPAHAFGHYRECWNQPAECLEADGNHMSNRKCCRSTDEEFRKAEADLYNFQPAIGQLNALRSDTPYGPVAGDRHIGNCDLEIADGFDQGLRPPLLLGSAHRHRPSRRAAS